MRHPPGSALRQFQSPFLRPARNARDPTGRQAEPVPPDAQLFSPCPADQLLDPRRRRRAVVLGAIRAVRDSHGCRQRRELGICRRRRPWIGDDHEHGTPPCAVLRALPRRYTYRSDGTYRPLGMFGKGAVERGRGSHAACAASDPEASERARRLVTGGPKVRRLGAARPRSRPRLHPDQPPR